MTQKRKIKIERHLGNSTNREFMIELIISWIRIRELSENWMKLEI